MFQAGDKVQRECDNHVSNNGRLLVADVFVSSAGNLPCKLLVHTTFPMWKNGILELYILTFLIHEKA